MSTSIREQSRQLNPDRHSNWFDGLKAGIVGGAVAGLPFAMAAALMGGAFAGAITNSVAGMSLAGGLIFGAIILQWTGFGAFVGTVAGAMAILRYQFDLSRLAVAMTIGWYFLVDIADVGVGIALFTGLPYNFIWGGMMGGLLGFLIGWADRTWFRKSNTHLDQLCRGQTPTTNPGTTAPSGPSAPIGTTRKPPAKVLPEAPKGDPPAGYKICKLPPTLPPLLAACKEGNRVKVEHALAQNPDIHERTPKRKLSAMHIAAMGGVMDVADCLLSVGLKVDELADRNITPLYLAIQTANMNMAGFLISRGANVNHVNSDGYTPLHWACCVPHERLVGSTRVKMVDMLIQQGADPRRLDSQGRSARDLATLYELKELGRALDRHMGFAPTPDTQTQEAEEDAIQVTSVERLDETEYADFNPDTDQPIFMLNGSEVANLPDDVSPLYQAVKEGDPGKAEMMLAGGGQLDERVGAGLTAIHLAAVVGAMGVVDLLVRSGANVNEVCDHHMTPIFLAVQKNNTNCTGYLLSKGASINHQNADGLTPLHWAAAVKDPKLEGKVRVQMIEMLLQHGADSSIRDNQGRTARQLAEAAGHDNVLEYFDSRVDLDHEGGSDDYDDDYDEDDYHL